MTAGRRREYFLALQKALLRAGYIDKSDRPRLGGRHVAVSASRRTEAGSVHHQKHNAGRKNGHDGKELAGKTQRVVAAIAVALALRRRGVAQPVEIRMGVGTASEEQAWLMKARPDLTPNQGKAYTYTMSMFRSGGDRMTAFQAGQLDAVTASTTGVLFAASKGVPCWCPVSMARESTKTFSTSYLALADSDVSLTNLKGKTIGINGYRTSIELYARIAVAKAGLDPDRDVKWLVVPLPQMTEALRQKKIDIGVFPSTFAFVAMKQGGVRKIFDCAGISGIEEEFDVAFNPDFVRKNSAAVRAWVSDFSP